MTDSKVKLVKGKIDGREVEVREGTTILEAAKSVGIEIPHFCYHPAIGIEGSCRMCLVEIKGRPKLEASCAAHFTEGIEVITDSETVRKARKGVLEFLLINHPLDCPICDKGGECPLQNYSFNYGAGRSRFEEDKRHLAKHKILGNHIIFDSERCILCSRCVRFYRDVVGTHELVIKKRGHTSEITSFKEEPLSDVFSGNLEDICPVGALMARDSRFQARPWEMKTFNSACGICGLNCSVQIWKKTRTGRKKIMRLTPAYNPQVNGWWLCDRGRFGWKDIIRGKRLTAPLLREGKAFRGLNLSEALAELSGILTDLFKKEGKGRFKIISSKDVTNEEVWMLKGIAEVEERRGSVVFDFDGARPEFHTFLKGRGLLAKGFEDFTGSPNLLFLGTNIAETHPVLYLKIRNLVTTGRAKLHCTPDFRIPDESLIFSTLVKKSGIKKDLLKEIQASVRGIGNASLFIDESWVSKEMLDPMKSFVDFLKDRGIVDKVAVLGKADYNTSGILELASTCFGYREEIDSILSGGAAKELLLIGDDVIDRFIKDPAFDSQNYNFICMIKKFDDDNMKHAHLVLPQRSFMEKSGTLTNVFGTVQKLAKTWQVTKEAVSEWKILSGLATLLGFSAGYLDEEEIYGHLADFVGTYPREFSKIEGVKEIYAHYNRELRK